VRALVLAALLAGCAARQTTNVERLIASVGVDRARAELEFRVASHPKDLDAHRALAILEDEHGRPGAALRHLLIVERAGGLLGTRWATEDRERLAWLLRERGEARVGREAASALDDLERARRLGGMVEDGFIEVAESIVALTELKHSSDAVRKQGLQRVKREAKTAPSFAKWLWQRGAKRAALEVLDASHDGPEQTELWLRAKRWWSLPEGDRFDAISAPEIADGPPCLPAAQAGDARCSPLLAAGDRSADGPRWEPDLVATSRSWELTRDPEVAAAWVVVGLREYLERDGSWLGVVRARVDVSAVADAAPVWARSTLLRAAGKPDDAITAVQAALVVELSPGARLVVAAEAALARLPEQTVRDVLAPIATSSAANHLLRMVKPDPPASVPFSTTAAEFASRWAFRGASMPMLERAAIAYTVDPARADRAVEDIIDGQVDVVVGCVIGASLFDALGDLPRARALWQRAVEESPEQAWVLELALVTARSGDGDAALVHLTRAAAASGDPAPVLIAGGRALLEGGRDVLAIEVAHQAIELAGPDAIGDALSLAADASTAAGRNEQAATLRDRRARLIRPSTSDPSDPADAAAAVAATATRPPGPALDALAVAAQWNPWDVATRRLLISELPATDPRARLARYELSRIAAAPADLHPDAARAALAALRAHP
jgi:hypothetical protein